MAPESLVDDPSAVVRGRNATQVKDEILMNCLSFLSSSLPLKVQLSSSSASCALSQSRIGQSSSQPSGRVIYKKLFSDSEVASHKL